MKNYNKYKNKHVIIDEIDFMSIKEAKRYNELKWLEKAGIIKELELQKQFELQPKFKNKLGEHIRAITYVADFYYIENDKEVVEDVKGSKNIRTEVYKIKKKLFEYKYPNIIFKEVI